jgi:uncharacterized protein (TIGR02996 family)
MTEQDFLKAIHDDPDALEHYLVFADWLEEQGESKRAQLIRLEIDREKPTEDTAQKERLAAEATKLQGECAASWPAYQQWRKVFSFQWRRGLPSTAVPARPTRRRDQVKVSVLRSLPGFPYLTTLETNEVPAPALLAPLVERTSFHTLRFHYRSAISDDQVQTVGQLTQLRGLVLEDMPVTGAGLAHLEPLRQLRSLNLTHTQVGDAGISHLRGMSGLEELRLWDTPITDAGLEHLRDLRQLKVLDLAFTQVTDAGLEHLRGLQQLKVLNLSDTHVTAAGLEWLRGLSQLTSLNVNWTQIGTDPIDTLVQFQRLRTLKLAGVTAIDDTNVMRLAALPDLEELDLSETGVTRYRLHRLLAFPRLKRVRLRTSLGIVESAVEMREIETFLQDMREGNLLVDIDYE